MIKTLSLILTILASVSAHAVSSEVHERTILGPHFNEIYAKCLEANQIDGETPSMIEFLKDKKVLGKLPTGYQSNFQKVINEPNLVPGLSCYLSDDETFDNLSDYSSKVCSIVYWNAMAGYKTALIDYFNDVFKINRKRDSKKNSKSCMTPLEVSNAWDKLYARMQSHVLAPVDKRSECVYHGTRSVYSMTAASMFGSKANSCLKGSDGCRTQSVRYCQGNIKCYENNKHYKQNNQFNDYNTIYSKDLTASGNFNFRYFAGVVCKTETDGCPSASNCLDNTLAREAQTGKIQGKNESTPAGSASVSD